MELEGNGTFGMVRFNRRQDIKPFHPPRFPFENLSGADLDTV